ncbi:MAG: ABC transporter permease subunit [Ilumatobacteraceae bacterium]|nr:ABC transporter permease subunit [Ilumatobacteraceae bacterium]
MKQAVRFEFGKLLRRPAMWWATVAAAVMAIVFGYLIPYLVGPGTDGSAAGNNGAEAEPGEGYSVPLELLLPERLVENAISGFPLFYLALALVLGALSSGNEYQWRTIRSLALWGRGRTTMIAAKALTLVVSVVLLAVAAFVAGAASALTIAAIEGASASPPPAVELVRGLAAAWLILAVGAGIGLAGGIIARSGGTVIGAGLVYLFVVELLLRNFAAESELIEAAAKVLPGTNAGSLAGSFAETAEGAPGVSDLVGATQAVVVLLAWLLVSIVAATATFTRRDISA